MEPRGSSSGCRVRLGESEFEFPFEIESAFRFHLCRVFWVRIRTLENTSSPSLGFIVSGLGSSSSANPGKCSQNAPRTPSEMPPEGLRKCSRETALGDPGETPKMTTLSNW